MSLHEFEELRGDLDAGRLSVSESETDVPVSRSGLLEHAQQRNNEHDYEELVSEKDEEDLGRSDGGEAGETLLPILDAHLNVDEGSGNELNDDGGYERAGGEAILPILHLRGDEGTGSLFCDDSNITENSDLEVITRPPGFGSNTMWNDSPDLVIELDSEEEIDNLESDEESSSEHEKQETLNEGGKGGAEDTIEDDRRGDLAADEKAEEKALQKETDGMLSTQVHTDESNIPSIIEIQGKRYLLIDFDGESRIDLLHMPILFEDDTDFGTIEDFLELIRTHDDVDFGCNPEELVLRVPGLHIRIGLEHKDAKGYTFESLWEMYCDVIHYSKRSIPEYMLFIVTSESRFSTRYFAIQDLVRAHKGLEHVRSALGITDGDPDSDTHVQQGRKRRHFYTGL